MILLSWMSSESFPQEVLLVKTTDTSGDIVSITVETMAEQFRDLISSQTPDWSSGSEKLHGIS